MRIFVNDLLTFIPIYGTLNVTKYKVITGIKLHHTNVNYIMYVTKLLVIM